MHFLVRLLYFWFTIWKTSIATSNDFKWPWTTLLAPVRPIFEFKMPFFDKKSVAFPMFWGLVLIRLSEYRHLMTFWPLIIKIMPISWSKPSKNERRWTHLTSNLFLVTSRIMFEPDSPASVQISLFEFDHEQIEIALRNRTGKRTENRNRTV